VDFLAGSQSTYTIYYMSPAKNSTNLNEKGEADLRQIWMILTLIHMQVGTSIILTMVFRSHASNLEVQAC